MHAVFDRLDDEAVSIAVGIKLGLNLHEPHTCYCGALDEAVVSIVLCACPPADRTARHHALNEIIERSRLPAFLPLSPTSISPALMGQDSLTLVS